MPLKKVIKPGGIGLNKMLKCLGKYFYEAEAEPRVPTSISIKPSVYITHEGSVAIIYTIFLRDFINIEEFLILLSLSIASNDLVQTKITVAMSYVIKMFAVK